MSSEKPNASCIARMSGQPEAGGSPSGRARNARIEQDKALVRAMTAVMKDDTELFKQFMDNEGFRRWMTDTVFGITYAESAA